MKGPLTVLAVALAVLAGPVASPAQEHGHGGGAARDEIPVEMAFATFNPARVDILAGETVRWTNGSVRAHIVADTAGTFDSGRVIAGDVFAHRFDTPGLVAYHCEIHPGMTGEVAVHQVLLDRAAHGAAPGRGFPVTGRSSLEPGTDVAIEADEGAGFHRIAATTVAFDGSIAATITPSQTAVLRAVAGGASSPPVQLLVFDRTVRATVARRGANAVFSASVTPGSPGSTVVVQLRLPERFGWWPVRTARLDRASRARIVVPMRRRVPARVLLTLPDGATVLASSGPLRVPPAPARR